MILGGVAQTIPFPWVLSARRLYSSTHEAVFKHRSSPQLPDLFIYQAKYSDPDCENHRKNVKIYIVANTKCSNLTNECREIEV